MRAPHAPPPPPLPSRIRKTISAYECLVIVCVCVCVCVRERERERDDYVSMWISIPRDNNPKSSLLFSKSKIMHSDLLRPWNAHFFRTHYTARVRRRQCARAFFPSFYDRYFPVLYRYIRTVWVLSFTSLRSIPLLKAAGC